MAIDGERKKTNPGVELDPPFVPGDVPAQEPLGTDT